VSSRYSSVTALCIRIPEFPTGCFRRLPMRRHRGDSTTRSSSCADDEKMRFERLFDTSPSPLSGRGGEGAKRADLEIGGSGRGAQAAGLYQRPARTMPSFTLRDAPSPQPSPQTGARERTEGRTVGIPHPTLSSTLGTPAVVDRPVEAESTKFVPCWNPALREGEHAGSGTRPTGKFPICAHPGLSVV